MMVFEQKDSSCLSWRGGAVTDHAYCVLAPNPSPLTNVGTNTWIVGKPAEPSCVVIDPGPVGSEHIYRIQEICRAECKKIVAILITHCHSDHAPAAIELSERTGAPILSRLQNNLPEGFLEIEGTSLSIEAISLPGHSSDSVGFLSHDDRSFFTGDVIFSHSSTMIKWPDGPLAQYLDTLDKIAQLARLQRFERLLTGHGIPINNPNERIAICRRHRLQRLNQVIAAVRSGIPAQADKLVDALYNDVEPILFEAAERSVNAQLRYAFDKGLLEEHRQQN